MYMGAYFIFKTFLISKLKNKNASFAFFSQLYAIK